MFPDPKTLERIRKNAEAVTDQALQDSVIQLAPDLPAELRELYDAPTRDEMLSAVRRLVLAAYLCGADAGYGACCTDGRRRT